MTSHYISPRRAYLDAKANREMLKGDPNSFLSGYSTNTGAIDYQAIAKTFREAEEAKIPDEYKKQYMERKKQESEFHTKEYNANALSEEIYNEIGTKLGEKKEFLRKTTEEIYENEMNRNIKSGEGRNIKNEEPMIQTERMVDILRKNIPSIGSKNDNDLYRAINEAGGLKPDDSSQSYVSPSKVLENLGILSKNTEEKNVYKSTSSIDYVTGGGNNLNKSKEKVSKVEYDTEDDRLHRPFVPFCRIRKSNEETYGVFSTGSPYSRTTRGDPENTPENRGPFVDGYKPTVSTMKYRYFNMDHSKMSPSLKNISEIQEQIKMDDDENNINYKREVASNKRTISPYSRYKGAATDSIGSILLSENIKKNTPKPRAFSANSKHKSVESGVSDIIKTTFYPERGVQFKQDLHTEKKVYKQGDVINGVRVPIKLQTLSTFCGNQQPTNSEDNLPKRSNSPSSWKRNESSIAGILSGTCPITYTNSALVSAGGGLYLGNPIYKK